jgi:DNA primase
MNEELIIDNHVIKEDIRAILSKLKAELTNGKLADIKYKSNQVIVTCPFHKDGRESHPSCSIYVGEDEKIPWGTFHCFTCGESGNLVKFISLCLECSDNYAKGWLKKNFTERVVDYLDRSELDIAGEIDLRRTKDVAKKETTKMIDEFS